MVLIEQQKENLRGSGGGGRGVRSRGEAGGGMKGMEFLSRGRLFPFTTGSSKKALEAVRAEIMRGSLPSL